MKIAIFHNYMDNIGGAEKVGLLLAREIKADIYTTVTNKEFIKKMGFNIPIKTIGWIPVNAPFRQQMAQIRFRNLNLKREYDYYFIEGDWSLSGAINNKPSIWYVHSPIREIWDLYEYTRKNNVPYYARQIFDMWVKYNRRVNIAYSNHVSKIICNSENTKKRLKKYLNKDAEVVYPPVETNKYKYKKNVEYWLSVNRLITHKRIEMQIKAFRELPKEKLIIVGSYEKSRHFREYADYINKIKPDNVEIVSWISSEQLNELYSNCKGFITTALNEDFGLTPVEAMASGKAVIAPEEGGYKETIINGVTGILIKAINAEKLISAIKIVGKNPERYRFECIKRAKNFDLNVFMKKIR